MSDVQMRAAMKRLFKHTNPSTMTIHGFTLDRSLQNDFDIYHASQALYLHQKRGEMAMLTEVGIMDKMRKALSGRIAYSDLIEPLSRLANIDGFKILAGKTIRALNGKSDDRKKHSAITKMVLFSAEMEAESFIREASIVNHLSMNTEDAKRAIGAIGFLMDDDFNLTKVRDLSITFAPGHKFSESRPYGDGIVMINFHGPQQECNERIQTLLLTCPVETFMEHTVPYR